MITLGLALSMVLLSSCTTGRYVCANTGAELTRMDFGRPSELYRDYTLTWSGGIDENGKAIGEGKQVWTENAGNRIEEFDTVMKDGYLNGFTTYRFIANGVLQKKEQGHFVRGIKEGEHEQWWYNKGPRGIGYQKFFYTNGHATKMFRRYNSGGWKDVQFAADGSTFSEREYSKDGALLSDSTPGIASSYQSDDSDASDIIGTMFALGGAAGGDASVTAAGLQMMAGDDAGAVQTLQQNTTRSGAEGSLPGSSSAALAGASSGAGAGGNKANLIDSYGLGRYRGNGGQIGSYISAADRSYSDYKKSGEENYYIRHREYADLARQFHQQTSTRGTRIGG